MTQMNQYPYRFKNRYAKQVKTPIMNQNAPFIFFVVFPAFYILEKNPTGRN
jgi:hypothetical protein